MHGQAAIRLDDAISGVLIYGNVFYRSSNGNFGAVQINSGCDNVIDNNVFAECRHGVSGGWNPENAVWRSIRDGNPRKDFYLDDLYLSRYPGIAHMMDPPGINSLWRNVFYQCGSVITKDAALFDMLANGVYDDDPGFVDAREGDFRLRPDAALYERVGFRPIPAGRFPLWIGCGRRPVRGVVCSGAIALPRML